MSRALFVDLSNRRLAASTGSLSPASPPEFVAGDNEQFKLFFLQATGSVVTPLEVVNKSGAAIRLGIGNPTATPNNGTFKLVFGGITASLNFTATAGAISAALNELTTMQAAGGCAVTGGAGNSFIVRFNSNNAQSTITAIASDLFPTTSATTTRVVTGGVQQEVQEIVFKVSPFAFQNTWTAITGAATYMSAFVNLDTRDFRDFTADQNRIPARLEIQITDADGTSTAVASDCVCKNQILV